MGRKRRAHGAPDSENAAYEGCADPLLVALFQEDADGARCLIEGNLCSIEAVDQLGWRPLHRASYAGLEGIVSLLLERRADANALDAEGVGPLHVAASKGHPECCKLLVEARADPTEPDRCTGMTPQIYAMSKQGELAAQLGDILGTVDWKLLAAWSNPADMAKLIASAETEEEEKALERKFHADLDKPAGCGACDEADDGIIRIVKRYTWSAPQKSEEACKPKGFWEAAMEKFPALEDRLWIQEWDEPVLRYCSDVTTTHMDQGDLHLGFKLTLRFSENPYFTNGTLEKEYHASGLSSSMDEISVTEIRSSAIDWRPGKDVTVEQVGEGSGAEGEQEGDSEQDDGGEERRFSFFRNFFCCLRHGGPLPDDFDEVGVRERTGMKTREQMLGMLMGMEYELGCLVRDQLVPFAARWRADAEAAAVALEAVATGSGEKADGGTPGGDID